MEKVGLWMGKWKTDLFVGDVEEGTVVDAGVVGEASAEDGGVPCILPFLLASGSHKFFARREEPHLYDYQSESQTLLPSARA
jgi:hypothetical protein